jgi:hypothetical protein
MHLLHQRKTREIADADRCVPLASLRLFASASAISRSTLTMGPA